MGNEADLIVNGLRFGLVLDAVDGSPTGALNVMDVGRRALRPCMPVSRPLRDGVPSFAKWSAFRTMWQSALV